MSPHDRSLMRALQHQQAGQLAQAEAVCRQIVQKAPRYAEAWNLLGILAFQSGKIDAALEHFERASQAAPANPGYRNNRGAILQKIGRFAEAEQEFREVLRLDPTHADANNNLGTAMQDQGRSEEAEGCFRRALALRADYPEAHNNCSISLRTLKRPTEAESCARRAIELRPDYAEAHNNLGAALQDQGRYADAAVSYRRAIELVPSYAVAHNNLGNVLARSGRYDEAEIALRRAVEFSPSAADAHYNLANVYMDTGRMPEAETCLRRALQLRPDDAEFHTKLALLQLTTGDYERGLPEYEWRWRLKNFRFPTYPRPKWEGEPLIGKRILLSPEQGIGDTIHFLRYAPMVQARGATVLFHCPRPLLDLVRTAPGIDQIVPDGAVAPVFDVHAPLLTLPRLFGTTVATIPAAGPYLAADDRLVETWRERLAANPGFRVGIVWQGAGNYNKDNERSVPLSHFEPLTRIPNVSLLSLQVGPGIEQLHSELRTPNSELGTVVDLGSQFDASSFNDAAAVVKNLDLVITVDTALAHLAGALGAPVWVALPFMADWRWLLGREDSPWYPTLRLVRQQRPRQWDDVFARLAQMLASKIAEK